MKNWAGSEWARMITAAAVVASFPAAAQAQGQNIREIAGQVNSNSPRDNGSAYQVQVLDLKQGQRYGVGAVSSDFDPKLRVSFADDYDETIAEDDDGGEGTNSYLEFIAKRAGKYRFRITALNENNGRYQLQLKELAPLPALLRPTASATSNIRVQHFDAALSSGDAVIKGQLVDDYLFRFEAGKQVFIFMDAVGEGLDPYLLLLSEDGRDSGNALATDDDSGSGLNAMISFKPETTGNYIVRATSISGAGVSGRYQLRVGQ